MTAGRIFLLSTLLLLGVVQVEAAAAANLQISPVTINMRAEQT